LLRSKKMYEAKGVMLKVLKLVFKREQIKKELGREQRRQSTSQGQEVSKE